MKKKTPDLKAAAERYVASLCSEGAGSPLRAALLLQVVADLDAAPPYARARIATELRAVMAELEAAEEVALAAAEQEAWRAKRRADRNWAERAG